MLDQIRLLSILRGLNFPDSNSGIMNVPDQGVSDNSELVPQQNEAQDRLIQMLGSMPTREENKPSLGRKIGAIAAALGSGGPVGISNGSIVGYQSNIEGGLKAKNSILNEPYNKAIGDWETKLKPIAELASVEKASNTNNRLVNSQIIGERKATADRTEKAREADLRDTNADEDRKIRQQRADAYEFKSKNPAYKSVIDEDGKLVFWNPGDPTKIIKTDIDTGKLSDIEKSNLQIEGRLKEIQAQGNIAAGLEDTRQEHRVALKSTPSGTPANVRTNTPAQDKIALRNRYNQIISEHPDLKKYYEVDASGNVTVKGSSGFSFGLDPTKRDEAYNLLFPPASGRNQTPSSVEKVVVEKDGKRFNLPKAQLEEAIKQGYKEVGSDSK